ncbi:MAG TPA: NUDIX domain-containing protein [Candidatus Woesearchaeota archaeon]|nr:NUDIX domain-containing protein [Candidatus Woesearchaeota archaeon]
MQERPRTGVGVIVVKDRKVLLGKRKNAHGEGCWSFPGGHLELYEDVEECAAREVMEETGISIKNSRKAAFTNDIFEKEQKHYVTLFIVSDFASGEVFVKEPDKCEKWEWFHWDDLPEPLFIPIRNLLKQGYNPLG